MNWNTSRIWWEPNEGPLAQIPRELLHVIKRTFVESPEDNLKYFDGIISKMLANVPKKGSKVYPSFFDALGEIVKASSFGIQTAGRFPQYITPTMDLLLSQIGPFTEPTEGVLDCISTLFDGDVSVSVHLQPYKAKLYEIIIATITSEDKAILQSGLALAGDCSKAKLVPKDFPLLDHVVRVIKQSFNQNEGDHACLNNAFWCYGQYLKAYFEPSSFLPTELLPYEEQLAFFITTANNLRLGPLAECIQPCLATLYSLFPSFVTKVIPNFL